MVLHSGVPVAKRVPTQMKKAKKSFIQMTFTCFELCTGIPTVSSLWDANGPGLYARVESTDRFHEAELVRRVGPSGTAHNWISTAATPENRFYGARFSGTSRTGVFDALRQLQAKMRQVEIGDLQLTAASTTDVLSQEKTVNLYRQINPWCVVAPFLLCMDQLQTAERNPIPSHLCVEIASFL